MSRPKILVLDIEWKPAKVWVWRAWDENVNPEQVIDAGGLLCVGMKWVGGKSHFYSEWEHGIKGMLRETHRLMSEADAIVTQNGNKYDLPKLAGEFCRYGFHPVAPPTSIDLRDTTKSLGLFMSRLAFIGPFFKMGKKVEHEGFALWTKVMAGCEKAQKRMARYCMGDVRLQEKMYLRLLPYIKNHPYLGNTNRGCCGACGSKRMILRGFRRTKANKIQRLQCNDCGSWQSGAKIKVG